MKTSAVLIVFAAMLCGTVSAHICLFHPEQRGGFDISGPAENICYKKVGPCGQMTPGAVKAQIPAGKPYTVHFQQNANHYYTGKPGQLVLDWANTANPNESDFQTLVSIQDYNAMGELTQTNFTRTVSIPPIACSHCVLRARYVTNNPDEDPQGHGPTFYQCSDVEFVMPEEAEEAAVAAPAAQRKHRKSDGTNACCSPDTFSTSFVMQKPMTSSKGDIVYDNKNHMMREDITHGAGTGITATNGRFIIYSNFTSGNGYYFNVNTGECMLGGAFGLDLWNEWCFGSAMESESYTTTGACPAPASGSCNFYQNEDWTFGATVDECLPASIKGTNGNFADVVYFGAKVGPVNPTMFNPPAVCLSAASQARKLDATSQQAVSLTARLGRE